MPADDILDGFTRIREYLKTNPEALGAYLPMLEKYDIHIFEICENAKQLARILVQQWLQTYMFKSRNDRAQKSTEIAQWLSEHREHHSHARTINMEKCIEKGIAIKDLRATPDLRNEVWTLYCLIEILFDRSPIVKLFENSRGVSWSRNFQLVQQFVQLPSIPPQAPPVAPPQPSQPPS